MAATLQIGQPDLTILPQTFVSLAAIPGDATLTVQNSTDFSYGNYIQVGEYGNPIAAIYPLTAPNPSISSIYIGNSLFGYPLDTPVTQVLFNQTRIYRSLTGLGGTYTLLATIPLQPDQNFTTYTDLSGISPYSYRYTFYNSNLNAESDFSAEMPYGGFPFYSLNAIQRRVLNLFVDSTGEFINQSSITDWCNELLIMFSRAVTDSESAPFVSYTTFTPGNVESIDLTTYQIESIMLMEYSMDGGSTWAIDTINPMDSRIKAGNPTSNYSYKLMGNLLFIYTYNMYGSGALVTFPANYVVRLWYFTQQTPLVLESDNLPALFRSFTEVFVDYCMVRANEQARRTSESAAWFGKKLSPAFQDAVDTIRGRINQGNKSMALTWSDSFSDW